MSDDEDTLEVDEEIEDEDVVDEELIDEDLEDVDDTLADDEYEVEEEASDDDDDDSDVEEEEAEEEGDPEAPAALDELEAEELEIVDEPTPQTMLVDEASEIRAIRRQELTLDVEAESPQGDEFVCSSCFLVLKRSQLANKRKLLCVDCA